MIISTKVKIENKTRFRIIDQVRGVAIVLMFISHSIDFFYSGDLFAIELIRWFTATVAFTAFIYLSGASNYIASIDKAGASELWQKQKLHLLIKTGQLLAVYYVLAVVLALLNSYPEFGQNFVSLIKDIILLKHIPTYTEFIITFVILNFSLVFFGRAYKFILRNPIAVLIVGFNFYILGLFFYQFDFGEGLNQYKALLVGHDQGYRFPVFQYFSVYLFGMKFGKDLLGKVKKFRIDWTIQLLLVTLPVFVFAVSKTWQSVSGEGILFLHRWPPSVSFLLVGILFVQLVILFYKLWNFVFGDKQGKLTFLEFLGRNPLDFYVLHILLLELYRTFIGTKTENIFLILLGFSGLLFLVSSLVFVKQKLKPSSKSKLEQAINGIINQRVGTAMKHFYRLGALLIIIGIGVVVFNKIDISGGQQIKLETEGFVQGVTAPAKIDWWNKNYKYYIPLTISNKDTDRLLAEDSTLSFVLNHEQLVESEKSLETAEDLAVVYLRDDEYQQLEILVEDANSEETAVHFKLQENIAPDSSIQGYYLYYGNRFPETDDRKVLTKTEPVVANYEVTLGEEQSAVIVTQLSRLWYLKDYSGVSAEDQFVEYKIQLTTSEEIAEENLLVILNGEAEQQFAPDKLEKNIYELKIPIERLNPGDYNIKTIVVGENYESDSLNFKVSYPLFVTWTIDWEGYDVSEENLKVIGDLANSNKMPLTTFFNPRIFIANDVPENRKTRLVNWVLAGQKERGDEIGLHLHMHLDMITAAGLEAKTEPRWGGRENGHDVLTTAYDYDEFRSLVVWSLDQFAKNNLPVPDSYRAGGWFMDEENLKVLDDLGFKIDSSGREPIKYGPNQIENPWKLSSITRPYQPSIVDQNSSLEPTLDLWEFPNNGMDSTNRNYDILIEKFVDNYKGVPLNQSQTVTYLSHPHWFTQFDSEDMKKVLEFTGHHKYEEDKGAVVFVTLTGALEEID